MVQIFLADGRVNRQRDKGVSRGPRWPKKLLALLNPQNSWPQIWHLIISVWFEQCLSWPYLWARPPSPHLQLGGRWLAWWQCNKSQCMIPLRITQPYITGCNTAHHMIALRPPAALVMPVAKTANSGTNHPQSVTTHNVQSLVKAPIWKPPCCAPPSCKELGIRGV